MKDFKPKYEQTCQEEIFCTVDEMMGLKVMEEVSSSRVVLVVVEETATVTLLTS